MTDLRNADLNLLTALAVLLEERHVSRAANRLHLSQPAMSRTLHRLRDTFGDELLVRTRHGYEPTVRGHQLQWELADLLPRLETLLRGNGFDPATATAAFHVHCTDYATSVLGPAVFQRVSREAPRISLTVEPLSDRSFADVEQGRVGLVLSGVVAPESLHWETLFEEDFVCLLAHDHPATGDRLTLADFGRYPHVVVVVLDGEQTMVDRRLAELGRRRFAGLRVPYFSAAPAALPGTDLVATLPRRGAAPYLDDPAYRVVEAPVEIQPFPYGIAWHPRVDGDPAHQWLRKVLRDAAAETTRTKPAPRRPS
ncbi:LysR family transcriptional regulator [Umezawaea endophytica]|uniref:LysR family transcriptional regulator n=1 Tax=Umezawaea endophytica TaxID=1654476 RepID=A0A9X2VPE0_9PSEU|nr:LysR family transcriptional regulator [Umezawaea endophytica]MCS7480333.1 LysR family transcriptional regulator [Umezawaea endophytica]